MLTKEKPDRKGAAKRPDPPNRTLSFSKRHASFDSPREVPLPSPSLAQTAMRDTQLFADDQDWELISSAPAKLHKDKGKDKGKEKSKGGPITPYARPYSLPQARSYQGRPASEDGQMSAAPPTVDRSSSASLPLPMQIPFSTLPKAPARPAIPSPVLEREAHLRPPIPAAATSSSSSSSSSSGRSSGSLPSAPPSRSASPNAADQALSTQSPPPRRGPAPMPPPELTTSNSGSVASYRPPRTTYTPPVPAEATAIRRSASMSSTITYPPPDPPVIMHGDGDEAGTGADGVPAPRQNAALPNADNEERNGSTSNRTSTASSTRSSRASYEPFLSHAPPPVDSWIEVETTQAEYRLVVRLPGFKRDGITLATKKRRILHIVADSWEEGGGHFERRIMFGYDADLAQVRAEFDGELLKVIIPRRIPPGMQGAWVAPVGRAS